MIALGFTAAILCMAGIFACGMLAGHQLAHRKSEPIDWPAPLPFSAELAAANDAIHARDLIIEMLTTLRLVPVNEWTVLPWSAPPSHIEVAVSERLAVEVMDLREQLADALDDIDYFLAVARDGSLTVAARECNVTEAALSKPVFAASGPPATTAAASRSAAMPTRASTVFLKLCASCQRVSPTAAPPTVTTINVNATASAMRT